MAPEMAFSYVIGIVPSCALCGFHFYSLKKKILSPKTRMVQANLALMNLQWSFAEEKLKPRDTFNVKTDWSQVKKSIIILSSLMIPLSWLGFFFHLFLFFTLRKFAVSRLQKFIFDSNTFDQPINAAQISEYKNHLIQISPFQIEN